MQKCIVLSRNTFCDIHLSLTLTTMTTPPTTRNNQCLKAIVHVLLTLHVVSSLTALALVHRTRYCIDICHEAMILVRIYSAAVPNCGCMCARIVWMWIFNCELALRVVNASKTILRVHSKSSYIIILMIRTVTSSLFMRANIGPLHEHGFCFINYVVQSNRVQHPVFRPQKTAYLRTPYQRKKPFAMSLLLHSATIGTNTCSCWLGRSQNFNGETNRILHAHALGASQSIRTHTRTYADIRICYMPLVYANSTGVR